MSKFSEIQQAAPIAVFALTAAYKEDSNPNKVNAGVGGMQCFMVFKVIHHHHHGRRPTHAQYY